MGEHRLARVERMFGAAELFWHAVRLLSRDPCERNDPSLMAPLIVNAGHAIELYLKCLCTMQGRSVARVHNLQDLFGDLSSGTQDAIRRTYNATSHADPFLAEVRARFRRGAREEIDVGFDAVLKQMSTMHVKWRYPYEGELCGAVAYDHLRDALVNCALEAEPSLRATLRYRPRTWAATQSTDQQPTATDQTTGDAGRQLRSAN